MKKIYTLALSALLGAIGLSAQTAPITLTVNGEPSDKTFQTIVEAFEDAKGINNYEGKVTLVYTLHEDLNSDTRVLFDKSPSGDRWITFKSADPENPVTITRNFKKKELLFANKNSKYKLTFQDIIFDGGGDKCNYCLVEAEDHTEINLTNVTFQNITATDNNNGIFQYKGKDGSPTLTNVFAGEGIKLKTDKDGSITAGMININTRTINLSGTTNMSFRFCGNGNNNIGNLNITKDFTFPSDPISLYFENVAAGGTPVLNCNNTSLFKAVPIGNTPQDLALIAVGNNIIYAKPSAQTAPITLTVNGEPSDKTFSTLKDALNDAKGTDNYEGVVSLVYTIHEDLTSVDKGDRVLFADEPIKVDRYITFKSADPNSPVTITRDYEDLLFANKQSYYKLTFQDIIFDGGKKNNCFAEAEEGCTVNLINVKFQNIQNTRLNTTGTKNTNGIFQYKGTGSASLNNVTAGDGIVINENSGLFNINQWNLTIEGQTNLSFKLVYDQKKSKFGCLTIGNNFTSISTPIYLYLENVPSGLTPVEKCTDTSIFEAVPTGSTDTDLALIAVGGNIQYGKYSAKIGNKAYLSLQDAVAAAADDDVITLTGDQTITSCFSISKNITIKGAEGQTILLNYGMNSGIMLLFNDDTRNTNITLENLIIDGKGTDAGNQLIEASNQAHINLNNIVVRNCTNSGGPIIKTMGGGAATINGITMDNCNYAADNAFIFFGNSSSHITGDVNISLCLEKNNSVVCDGMNPTEPIDVVFAKISERTNDSDVLRKFTDIDKVNFNTTHWELVIKDGNDGKGIGANFVPAKTEGFYTVVKQSTPEYDAASAEETGETLDNIRLDKNKNEYKFIVFAEGFNIYVAPVKEKTEPSAVRPLATEESITVNGTTYNLLEGNVLPVTGHTSFIVKSNSAQSAPVAVTADVEAGIDTVDADNEAETVYYNLQGIRVEAPTHGLYIKKQGNKATKVLIK